MNAHGFKVIRVAVILRMDQVIRVMPIRFAKVAITKLVVARCALIKAPDPAKAVTNGATKEVPQEMQCEPSIATKAPELSLLRLLCFEPSRQR